MAHTCTCVQETGVSRWQQCQTHGEIRLAVFSGPLVSVAGSIIKLCTLACLTAEYQRLHLKHGKGPLPDEGCASCWGGAPSLQ